MDSTESTNENSNLLRLNGILQSRVDDLTEKLRLALQVQKDHLEELVRSQQIWRKDYSKLEEKYFLLERENEKLRTSSTETLCQTNELKESLVDNNRKLVIAQSEISDLKNQVTVLRIQNAEIVHTVAEKDEMFVVLKNQFDIVGKEFVELKSFSDSERLEHQHLIKRLGSEKQTLKESLLQLETKAKHQLSTQQELNDLLHNLGARLQIAEEALTTEKANSTAAIESSNRALSAYEIKCNELVALQSHLESQVSEIPLLRAANERQLTLQSSIVSERAQVIADLNRTRLELAVATSAMEELSETLKVESVAKSTAEQELIATRALLKEESLDREELQEAILNLKSQLIQSEDRLQQMVQESKIQLQESNDRILDVQRMNTQLEVDASAAKRSIATLQNELEGLRIVVERLKSEADESESKFQTTYSRVQALEDQHDLDIAKLESLSAEYLDFKENAASVATQHLAELDEALQKQRLELMAVFEKDIQTAKLKWDSDHLTLVEDMKSQKSSEMAQVIDMSVLAVRKTYEQNQVDLRNELSSVKKLFEDATTKCNLLDGENTKLRGQIASEQNSISALKVNHASSLQAAHNRCVEMEASHVRDTKRLEDRARDLMREGDVMEGEYNMLKRAYDELSEKLRAEQEEREALRQQLHSVDSRESELTNKLSKTEEDLDASRREVASWSRKYAALESNHETDVQRVTRRNQVLTETVTRLTAMTAANQSNSVESSAVEARRDVDSISRSVYEKPAIVETSIEGESSLEREQSRWSQSPPSAHRRKMQLQRGKSAPAVMPLRISTESLSGSIEKSKTSHVNFEDDEIEYDTCDIQEINTHRDEDTLSSIRQALIDDIRHTIGNSAALETAGTSSQAVSSRAHTAPSMRTPSTYHLESDQPSWLTNDDDSVHQNSALSSVVQPGQSPSVKGGVDESVDDAKVTIDRIQTAINQRRGLHTSHRPRGTVIRSKGLDKERSKASIDDDCVLDNDRVGLTTPTRTTLVRETQKVSPVSTGSNSKNFTKKLRSSVEEGEHHWIPFSPQSNVKVNVKSPLSTEKIPSSLLC